MAIKVKLRKKEITKNRQSLYLDFYPAIPDPTTGKPTRREFLGMYIFADRVKDEKGNVKNVKLTPLNKQNNIDTLNLAEQIRQKKENYLNKPEIYSGYEREQLKIKSILEINFVSFFKQLADKKKTSNHDNWVSTYNYLYKFTNGSLRFGDLNEVFCDNFKTFLLNTESIKSKGQLLSRNTCASYFNKFKEALKQAYKEGYLQTSINDKVDPIESVTPIKNTLTIEELNKLAKTDCPSPILKKATLFSALTGLPFKEMQNLCWKNIYFSEADGIQIIMQRQKTEKPYLVYISQQAFGLLGPPQKPDDRVFEGLSDRERYELFQLWLARAGITKKLTFHDLRHTYGTNQIEAGTDIYVLKGNMGHANVKYTQQYGHQSDKRKKEAAEKVKLDL